MARQTSFFWWALTYMTCTGEEEKSLPTAPSKSEQVYGNRKSYHSMNVQMVCLADQYISQVNAMFPGSVHDAYILRNSSIPYVMGQLQRHRGGY
ncbi:hypothetical protein NDU88_003192 [Pleurodeles waltl]|uniref:DDE Tnp4 domain-containing protein n=1 Tax=Pleurodeles waltl TaxID=8319 RepID=A0AAV7W1Q6_PLEWA|nr:hypothetical protein NDU88_003192 [Pleurodeles waltl]